MEDEDAFLYGDSEPAAPAKTGQTSHSGARYGPKTDDVPSAAFQAELKAADVPLGWVALAAGRRLGADRLAAHRQPMEGQEGFDTGTGAGTEAEEGEEEDIEEEDSDEVPFLSSCFMQCRLLISHR